MIAAMGEPQSSTVDVNGGRPNGEVVIGDMEHDGRVILYIIKGPFLSMQILSIKS